MSAATKILVADDEQAALDLVKDALADLDCQIVTAMDGQEALEAARRERPQLIILDVQMPKIDGFGVFAELKKDEALAKVPVVMLTAVTERTGVPMSGRDMGEFLGAEPEAYVEKPIEAVVLKQAVKRLLPG